MKLIGTITFIKSLINNELLEPTIVSRVDLDRSKSKTYILFVIIMDHSSLCSSISNKFHLKLIHQLLQNVPLKKNLESIASDEQSL